MINQTKRLTLKRLWKTSPISDRKSSSYLPFAYFNTIMQEVTLEIENMLLEGNNVYLPYDMGVLRLMKFKPKRLLPDYNATKILWRNNPEMKKQRFIVKQTNEHTNGWRVKLNWNKYNCKWKYSTAVIAKRTRGFERRLAWLLKTDSTMIDKYKEQ